MSKYDGRVKDNVYLTSDISFAAYLLLMDFTLLGAVDTETDRKEFGLLPPSNITDVNALVQSLMSDYHDKHYRNYYTKIRDLRYSLTNPVRRTL